MALGTLVKKENVLETLVGGGCPNCASQQVTIKRFYSVSKLYTNITCRACSFDDDFQEKPGDHFKNKHIF